MTEAHHPGIVNTNRCLPGPRDIWRNEGEKYVQCKERIGNELARNILIQVLQMNKRNIFKSPVSYFSFKSYIC